VRVPQNNYIFRAEFPYYIAVHGLCYFHRVVSTTGLFHLTFRETDKSVMQQN